MMQTTTPTRQRILACARALIMAGGYASFSYADIAAAVGIRKPSIHHHFPSKVDLVRELLEHYRQEARTSLHDLESRAGDALRQLEAYAAHWRICIASGSAPFCMYASLASELPVLPEAVAVEVMAHFRALSAWLTAVFERGRQQHRLRLAGAPRIEAETFMATVHGAMLSARAHGDPRLFAAIVDPMLKRLSDAR